MNHLCFAHTRFSYQLHCLPHQIAISPRSILAVLAYIIIVKDGLLAVI